MCEKCGNRIGFAFGTCCNCGWNYLDKTYHSIKVSVDDLASLPIELKWYLIDKHNERIERIRSL